MNRNAKRQKFTLSILFIFLFVSTKAQVWMQIDDFPSTERDDGVSFVIGDSAYCGTGYKTGWVETKDFYSFNMTTDTWSTISALPEEKERQYATGFSSMNYGFVFGGINDDNYLNDIWEYNPELNNWVEKTALPAEGRSGSASFVFDNTAYIIGGKTDLDDAINEVWAYDISNDSWLQKNNLPFGSCFRSSAATQNEKGYLIFGKNEYNQFYNTLYEYDPALDSWTEISDFPDIGRSHSSLNSLSNHLIVFGGIDSLANYHNDIWSFNLLALSWQQLDSLPALGRKGGLSFNNGYNIYYTTGIDQENNRLKETWKSINPTSLEEITEIINIKIYPNPFQDRLIIEINDFSPSQNYRYSLFDFSGTEIMSSSITDYKSEITLSSLSKGLYFIQIRNSNQLILKKLVKQ